MRGISGLIVVFTIDLCRCTCHSGGVRKTFTTLENEGRKMITIKNATVEILDDTQARPLDWMPIMVTFGGHTFQILADADEVKEAAAEAAADIDFGNPLM